MASDNKHDALLEFKVCLSCKDELGGIAALQRVKANCEHATTRCLDEVFCNECIHGIIEYNRHRDENDIME